jgi:Cytochrome C oxidase, cbb3-type, subunit III
VTLVNHTRIALGAVALSFVALAGCRGQPSAQPPLVPERNMFQQQRYNPQARSQFFEDGRTMRKPVEHTFAREMNPSAEISDGELPDGSGYVMAVPEAVVTELGGMSSAIDRGEGRYGIYCTPCHDPVGLGKGTVVERGMAAPPSLHDDRIRHMPDGQLFATISRGVRNMPAYNYSIPVNDRWAIVAYVRALELSQAGEQ